jgi:hypothetical protein
VAKRLGYLDEVQFENLDRSIRQTGAALNGYIRAVSEGNVR